MFFGIIIIISGFNNTELNARSVNRTSLHIEHFTLNLNVIAFVLCVSAS